MTDTLAAYRATASEKDIQAGIVEGLTALGYAVLTIGQGRKRVRCPGCGMWAYPRGFQGNSEGAPDLLFRWPKWRDKAIWIAVEVKKPGGAVRKEQRALADAGHTIIAHSWDEVRDALRHYWYLLAEEGAE